MTGDGGSRPPLLLAIGVPDGLDREEAVKRFRGGKLPGVTGLSRALLPWLRRRGHPHVVTVFGADGVVTADSAHRMIEQTGGRVLINLICEPYVQRLALDQAARFELATGIAVVNSLSGRERDDAPADRAPAGRVRRACACPTARTSRPAS